MTALQQIRVHLTPGQVYRRADIEKWSNAVDRHLNQLQNEKALFKLSGGMYYCPKESPFGPVPPSDHELVKAFLKDDRFLLMTPNSYNSLGVGTTQLYNETVVYNHKRHGIFKLGMRSFRFVLKHHFPSDLCDEFLLVDLVDHINQLAENRERVLNLVKTKALSMNQKHLKNAIVNYGGVRAKKMFKSIVEI
ncbi:MAG: hypothetical protein CK425_11315 [Parachlamydia sp.]|nr:MAG: hypothetical protein CK425_11315 [Parachlamydia sp.]